MLSPWWWREVYDAKTTWASAHTPLITASQTAVATISRPKAIKATVCPVDLEHGVTGRSVGITAPATIKYD